MMHARRIKKLLPGILLFAFVAVVMIYTSES